MMKAVRCPNARGRTILLALVSLVAAVPAFGQSPELKDREIDLLKRRLEKVKSELGEERIGRIVYQTQIETAAKHGLKVGKLLEYEPLTPQTIERLLVESIQEQYPGRGFDLYNWTLRFFGAIPADMDVMRLMHELMVEQAGGVYDPFTETLYIKPEFDVTTAMGRMILAHEITHALQDQNYDLKGMGIWEPDNGDRSLALAAIIEGDASLMMTEILIGGDNPLALLADLPEMAMMDQQKLMSAPAFFRESMMFPYLDGMMFFQNLRGRTRKPRDGGEVSFLDPAWRNALFEDPPLSTEQILHPEKYLAGEMGAEIARLEPPAGYPHVVRDVMGELGVRLMLAPMVERTRAEAAAMGWNGDRMLVAENEAGTIQRVQWITGWDTPGDAEEFVSALRDALAARFGGEGLEWERDGDRWRAKFGAGSELTLRRPAAATVTLDGEVRGLPSRVGMAIGDGDRED
jgi:hypothetical protein